MGANTFTGGSVLLTANMNRGCHLCLESYDYRIVKKYKHGLQLCGHCQDVLTELNSSVQLKVNQF